MVIFVTLFHKYLINQHNKWKFSCACKRKKKKNPNAQILWINQVAWASSTTQISFIHFKNRKKERSLVTLTKQMLFIWHVAVFKRSARKRWRDSPEGKSSYWSTRGSPAAAEEDGLCFWSVLISARVPTRDGVSFFKDTIGTRSQAASLAIEFGTVRMWVGRCAVCSWETKIKQLLPLRFLLRLPSDFGAAWQSVPSPRHLSSPLWSVLLNE